MVFIDFYYNPFPPASVVSKANTDFLSSYSALSEIHTLTNLCSKLKKHVFVSVAKIFEWIPRFLLSLNLKMLLLSSSLLLSVYCFC